MVEWEDDHRNSALLNIDPPSLNLLDWSRRIVSKYVIIRSKFNVLLHIKFTESLNNT